MNLNILYFPNETGNKLLNLVESEWKKVEYREYNVDDDIYYEIAVSDPNTKCRRIINSPRAIKNARDLDTIQGILSLNGIATERQAEENVNRTYEVLLFDFNIISIRMTNHTKPKPQVKYIREAENSKVADMAKRTLHLLGLDLAMISVVLTARRRLKVSSINTAPIVRERDLEQIFRELQKLYLLDREVLTTEVKIGADPEFMLVNTKTGKMIAASEFFPREGSVGCDNIRMPNRQQRPIAEIRPRPDISPLEVVNNIKKALGSANKMAPYRNVKWVAGSQPIGNFSIGGHIHFSGVKINGAILRALDNYLGIPLFMLEEPSAGMKRRKKYGQLADYRVKDYGGFEYRTPGSWLVSEKIATAALCLAKIVASRYPYLPKNYLNSREAQKAFYSGEQEYFTTYFYRLWSDIQETDMYEQYKEHLYIIPEMIMSGFHWDEKADLRKSWKISALNKNYTSNKIPKENQIAPPAVTNTNIRTSRRSISAADATRFTTNNRSVSSNINRRANNPSAGRIISSTQTRYSNSFR